MGVAVVASRAVTRLLVGVRVCVFAMEVASVAKSRDAPKVQKVTLDYASHMVVDVGQLLSITLSQLHTSQPGVV